MLYSGQNEKEEMVSEDQARALITLLPGILGNMFRSDNELAGDLPVAQLRVCSILQDGPRSMTALSQEMGVSLSAMTQIADRLERSNLVKRVLEGTDRRIRRLQLTPHGEEVMGCREKERLQVALATLEQLDPATRNEVLRCLEILREASLTVMEKVQQNSQETLTENAVVV